MNRGWPKVTPIYGCGPFTPSSPCPHKQPIPPGSMIYCEVCGQSGYDHKPWMRRSATDPAPERPRLRQAQRSTPTAPVPEPRPMTRRERRLARFGPPRSRMAPADHPARTRTKVAARMEVAIG